ncbi:UNVERIFIED_CONTAM: Transposon TX1 uncharacterized protein [Sesamum angustifolium]|uniref:Transposon TX1 uncharacterized protein n=1 Tax=Sesamum angustifolium TaxID=2727405 RepID=A0AAW2KML7_9LAMI
MLNVSSHLPKHVVIMMPNELGGESACKVDVEYEWLPPKCLVCSSLGHSTKECTLSKPMKPAVSIYVRKSMPIIPAAPELKLKEKVQTAPVPEEIHPEPEVDRVSEDMPEYNRVHETILLTVVYGANDVSARRELWQGLIDWAVTVGNEPWLVGGDFNAVLDLSKVSGASGDIRVAMNEFNDCIIQTGILSLPMQGESLTWHNCSLDGRSLWKRLDRLLVNDVWMDRWPNLYYTCLTPRTSDHSPLVLKGDCRNIQVSLFRFDNYLALSPGFLASLQSIWRHHVVGTPMYSVTRKLKAHKPVFRQQRRCKGDLAMNVKLAAGFLEAAQNILQLDRHNSLLLLLEHCCRLVYLKASKLEQVMLRQRAKLQWLKGGDQCSRIFFRFVGGDRTARAIDLRYLRPWARHILSDDEARAIIRPVTIDEVKTAFFDIEEDKAPGPDGFSSGFFKTAWPVVGGEVSIAIMDFFKTGRLLKQVNATLLILIPKVRTPHSVADFRSISCCNVIYKVITKILVSRIRESLDLLISPSQNAFVLGRLISDNVLLAQELFSGYNQCRLPPKCALKVDLRKAYDTVEWDFLIATLQMFGFPVVFIGWVEECVTSAHYSVVVNGGVHGFFAGARGLRQGDPMSPYLFVLVMEVLHMILQQLIEQDGDFQYHWRCQELNLFQLSFTNDLLLLCKADVRSVNLFSRGLDLFATLSGLHTNPQKSQLIISKAALGIRDLLLATLGFQEGHLPVRYLGLPLISARLSIADCQPLLQKIDSRIKGWEGVQISFAGRVQLIKSILISFEVYWAMAFILPKRIINEMIKLLRTFLWKGQGIRQSLYNPRELTESSNSMLSIFCLIASIAFQAIVELVRVPDSEKVAWETICRPIEEGGLGIKDILALNRALMSKHLWAVIKQDRYSIWVDWIIQVRLRDCSIWTVKENKGTWGWKKMLSLRHSLIPHIHYRIGRGDSVSLWHDPWHPLGPLISRFPRDPDDQDGTLDKLSVNIKDGQWNWPLITDIACLEITHMLPPLSKARTESFGSLRMDTSTPRLLMNSSTHQDPKFSGPLF